MAVDQMGMYTGVFTSENQEQTFLLCFFGRQRGPEGLAIVCFNISSWVSKILMRSGREKEKKTERQGGKCWTLENIFFWLF